MYKKIYFALTYANSKPHLGNLFGAALPADFYHRFSKFLGVETKLISGADQYGMKVYNTAIREGILPEEFTEMNRKIQLEFFHDYDIFCDIYGGTMNEDHIKFVNNFFQKLLTGGRISEILETTYFCDRCENIISKTSNLECPICGQIATPKEAKEFFLEYQNWGVEDRQKISEIQINRRYYNEIMNYFDVEKRKQISRNHHWGVNIWGDSRTFYVWFEALLGYLSISREENFEDSIIFYGKDNLYFHSIFLPQIFGINIINSHAQRCGNYLLARGDKVSKSLGNLVLDFTPLQRQIIRGYLMSIMDSDRDSEFDLNQVEVYYQNLFLAKIINPYRRLSGVCPINGIPIGVISDRDIFEEYFIEIQSCRFRELSERIYIFAGEINHKISEYKIWKNKERISEIAEDLYRLNRLITPIFPRVADRISQTYFEDGKFISGDLKYAPSFGALSGI